MSWRPHGRAKISSRDPRALAVCDRCQFLFNHVDLDWQFEWRGPALQNLRILVCRSCMDVPQENVRVITLPSDPVPILNPRPQRAAGDGIFGETTVTPNPDPENPELPNIPP